MATPSTFAELDIVNQALTRMGENRISDLETDEAVRAQLMRENYQQVKERCLTKTSWRFATVKAALSKLSAPPKNRWEAAWQLPPDKLKVLFVYPAANYEIQGVRLFTNDTSSVEIDYIRYVLEGDWPAWFREYVVTDLIMQTVKGITGDDPTVAQEKARDRAEDDALFQNSQQQPNFTNLPNPFIDCRY